MSNIMKSGFKPHKTITALAVGTALLLSAPAVIAADAFNGTVKGNITTSDSRNAAGAVITLKHKSKGITRKITVDQNGDYTLRKLPVGSWIMTIEKDGYKLVEAQEVFVSIGSPIILNNTLVDKNADIERISIIGSSVRMVNTASSTGGLTLTSQDLELLPIASGFNSIALLTPGAAATNGSRFNGSPSIGGGSSAENGYYLNGLNITKIQTGLGTISLPWEAIAQTEVKTGGVSAEFGSAIGGIVNAVSKSGGNEFQFGGELRIDPESTRSHHDDLYQLSGSDSVIYSNYEDDENTFTRASIWASGAAIEDTLFFYALYAPQSSDYIAAHTTTLEDGTSESDRWFAKVDWIINDTHSLEFTALNYKNNDVWNNYSYDYELNERSGDGVRATAKTGGDVFGVKYIGLLTDNIALEVIAGQVTDQTYNTAADAIPRVRSYLTGSRVTLSEHTSSTIQESEFTRRQFRADLMWDLEDHSLKFGVDYYDTHVDYQSTQNGIGAAQGWWYIDTSFGGNDHSGLPAGENYVEQRIRTDFSDSHIYSTSFYAEDSWQVNDQLVLNLGVRYSNFVNEMSDGQKYVDVSGQIAPRLQAIYDINNDGSSKVFATFGRYFQPVSANMNIVQGGSRRDEHWYYEMDQVDANGNSIITDDGSPSRGDEVDYWLAQSGEGAPGSKATADLQPMYSDEFTVGYQTEIFDGDMTFGVRGVYRELKVSIEDANLKTVLLNWYDEQGIEAGSIDGWILFNPGDGLDVNYDFNGDGTTDHIVLSAAEVAMPKSQRKYGALEFTLDGVVTDKINATASYTWSHQWGNTAGLVDDDKGQPDPGWTESYDYAGLTDHSYGNLASDRRHAFKVFGSYQVSDNLTIGLNTLIADGRPISFMGIHPDDVDSCAEGMPWEACPSATSRGHGDSYYDENGNPSPRGTSGTTPWTVKIDLSASYRQELFGNDLLLKATVYNLLNSDTTTSVSQTGTTTADDGSTIRNPNWGMTTGRQSARYMSFTARYTF